MITSFSRSFQLSPCNTVVISFPTWYMGGYQPNAQGRTLPLEGLVNHKVHLFWRGCLTLKLSLSWKTVTSFPSISTAGVSSCSPSGETGIVLRSTCSSAILAVVCGWWGWFGFLSSLGEAGERIEWRLNAQSCAINSVEEVGNLI